MRRSQHIAAWIELFVLYAYIGRHTCFRTAQIDEIRNTAAHTLPVIGALMFPKASHDGPANPAQGWCKSLGFPCESPPFRCRSYTHIHHCCSQRSKLEDRKNKHTSSPFMRRPGHRARARPPGSDGHADHSGPVSAGGHLPGCSACRHSRRGGRSVSSGLMHAPEEGTLTPTLSL